MFLGSIKEINSLIGKGGSSLKATRLTTRNNMRQGVTTQDNKSKTRHNTRKHKYNTRQHEYNTIQHECNTIQHEYNTTQHEYKTT